MSEIVKSPPADVDGEESDDEEFESPSEVLPRLFQASKDVLQRGFLTDKSITHLLAVGETAPKIDGVVTLSLPLEDKEDANLGPHCSRAVNFIQEARKKDGRVLVYSRRGICRSSAMLVAYVMVHLNLNFLEALAAVRQQRASCQLSPSFVTQLTEWEESIERKSLTPPQDAQHTKQQQQDKDFLKKEVEQAIEENAKTIQKINPNLAKMLKEWLSTPSVNLFALNPAVKPTKSEQLTLHNIMSPHQRSRSMTAVPIPLALSPQERKFKIPFKSDPKNKSPEGATPVVEEMSMEEWEVSVGSVSPPAGRSSGGARTRAGTSVITDLFGNPDIHLPEQFSLPSPPPPPVPAGVVPPPPHQPKKK